jgi:hypothetical protein
VDFVRGFSLDPPQDQGRLTPTTKPDDTSVILRGTPIAIASDLGSAFVSDCARNREKIFSDARLQEKYSIDPSDWDSIVKNKTLRLAISAECERRMLGGIAAQELAAKIFMESPEAMGSILRDTRASPRARVAASQELRATSRVGDERSDNIKDHVTVTINLGNAPEDKLVFDCGPPRQTKEATDGETDQW